VDASGEGGRHAAAARGGVEHQPILDLLRELGANNGQASTSAGRPPVVT
jgi:hypothetical protein